MIEDISPVSQALLGTLLTWGLTAAGSAVVFLLSGTQRKVLDASLGFAAGVMTAASFWSLLAPAIEMAETSGSYGSEGEWAIIPVAIGFIFGAAFVYKAEDFLEYYGLTTNVAAALDGDSKKTDGDLNYHQSYTQSDAYQPSHISDVNDTGGSSNSNYTSINFSNVKQRHGEVGNHVATTPNEESYIQSSEHKNTKQQWRRILLLIVAITVHNIPEGLAVGVGFGAVGKTPLATFNKAKNLAVGIGIQNFPEGMAVSLPLRGAGYSVWKAFWYGQLSGMVEPFAGVLGAMAISFCEPLLPYALAFAAGAMIYVVVDDIVPEAQTGGNGRLSSIWCMVGFIVMMTLDVALG